ncbi:MAG TPA: hypothetical protein VGL23_20070, partial [Chloroflexota bacterium]
MPTRRALAALLLVLVHCAAVGCAPPPAPRGAETARWSDGEAVAALRARLQARGYASEVTAGPMVAVWDELAPASPLVAEPSIPRAARRDEPGAWLVGPAAGGWWVWEATDQGPLHELP